MVRLILGESTRTLDERFRLTIPPELGGVARPGGRAMRLGQGATRLPQFVERGPVEGAAGCGRPTGGEQDRSRAAGRANGGSAAFGATALDAAAGSSACRSREDWCCPRGFGSFSASSRGAKRWWWERPSASRSGTRKDGATTSARKCRRSGSFWIGYRAKPQHTFASLK